MPTTDPFTVIPAERDMMNGAVPPPSVFYSESVVDDYSPEDIAFMYETMRDHGIYTDDTLRLFIALNTTVHYLTGQRLVRPAGTPVYSFYYCRSCKFDHGREHFETLAAIMGVPFVPSDLA